MANVDLETVKFMSSEQFDEKGSTALSSINFVEQGILPSEKYDELTITGSGQLFTAPADGVYMMTLGYSASNITRSLYNENTKFQFAINTYNTGTEATMICPAKKGETVSYWSSGAVKSGIAKFYYY